MNLHLPTPTPKTAHLLNHSRWCHLANTLATYTANIKQPHRRNFNVCGTAEMVTTLPMAIPDTVLQLESFFCIHNVVYLGVVQADG